MFRNKRLNKPLSLIRLLPNVITLTALAIGVSAIRFSLEGRWEFALLSVSVSALLDALDGRVARFLRVSSDFGAELDSLSDFINFGVTPGLIIYIWAFRELDTKLLAWGCVLLYIICTAIRLARFNSDLISPSKVNKQIDKYFFKGVPAPFGAIIVLLPIMTEIEAISLEPVSFKNNNYFLSIYLVFVGFLMASRIPTFSLKYIKISPEYIWLGLLIAGALIISIINYTWYVLPLLVAIYFLSIPISCWMYYLWSYKNNQENTNLPGE
jgi:CDP-diacylglycerol--serine O-phosphatidyltransferase